MDISLQLAVNDVESAANHRLPCGEAELVVPAASPATRRRVLLEAGPLFLRLAVVDVDGTTLLVWAKTTKDSPDSAEVFADFEQMLAGLRFR